MIWSSFAFNWFRRPTFSYFLVFAYDCASLRSDYNFLFFAFTFLFYSYNLSIFYYNCFTFLAVSSTILYCFCLFFSYSTFSLSFSSYSARALFISSSFLSSSAISLSLSSKISFQFLSLSSKILELVLNMPHSIMLTDSSKPVFCFFLISLPSLSFSSLISSFSCLICAVLLEKATISQMYLSIMSVLFGFSFLAFLVYYASSCDSCRLYLSFMTAITFSCWAVFLSLVSLFLENSVWRWVKCCSSCSTLNYMLSIKVSLVLSSFFYLSDSFVFFFNCEFSFLSDSAFLRLSFSSSSSLALSSFASNAKFSLLLTSLSSSAFCLSSLDISSLSSCLKLFCSPLFELISSIFLSNFSRYCRELANFCYIEEISACFSASVLFNLLLSYCSTSFTASTRPCMMVFSSSALASRSSWSFLSWLNCCSITAFFLRLASQSLLIIVFSCCKSLNWPCKMPSSDLLFSSSCSSCLLASYISCSLCMLLVSSSVSCAFLTSNSYSLQ